MHWPDTSLKKTMQNHMDFAILQVTKLALFTTVHNLRSLTWLIPPNQHIKEWGSICKILHTDDYRTWLKEWYYYEDSLDNMPGGYNLLSFFTNSSMPQAAKMNHHLLPGSWYSTLLEQSHPIIWSQNAVSCNIILSKKCSQEGTIKSIISAQHKETLLIEMKVKEIEKKLLESLLIHGDMCWWIGKATCCWVTLKLMYRLPNPLST